MKPMLRIAVAGASGFVGRQLCEQLAQEHQVVAISRQSQDPNRDWKNGIISRRADLFSLKQIEEALQGADIAVYLIHSMLPANRLTQGSFADLDAILADNFARAAKRQGVKRIIYLGGLIPGEGLSPHLSSRLEVEWILASQGTPLITLRAGLIVGTQGSSFVIMERLVRRLPIMLCPAWTTKLCQPIHIDNVVHFLKNTITDGDLPSGAYDIGGPDQISYLDMMRETARILDRTRWFFAVPFMTAGLSKLWLRLITQTPKQLVYPLVESLRHDMICHSNPLAERYHITPAPIRSALHDALKTSHGKSPAASSRRFRPRLMEYAVTSVQRIPIAPNQTIAGLTKEYADWVQTFMRPFIRILHTQDGSLKFYFRFLPFRPGLLLLELTFSPERSDQTRQLFYISNGSLLAKNAGPKRGRFEFRRLPNSDEALTAVLDFYPRLPWWIYRYSQALIHLLVMTCFRRHMQKSLRPSRH
jgi:uncharacterized protein YbjT (DUF2867 family)